MQFVSSGFEGALPTISLLPASPFSPALDIYPRVHLSAYPCIDVSIYLFYPADFFHYISLSPGWSGTPFERQALTLILRLLFCVSVLDFSVAFTHTVLRRRCSLKAPRIESSRRNNFRFLFLFENIFSHATYFATELVRNNLMYIHRY